MKILFFKILKLCAYLLLALIPVFFFIFYYFSNYTYTFNNNYGNFSINTKDFNNFYVYISVDLSKYSKNEIYNTLLKILNKKKDKKQNLYNKISNYLSLKLRSNNLNYTDSYLFFNEILSEEINKNYFFKSYLKLLKFLKKNNINLNIKINLYNLKYFKINLINLSQEEKLLFIDKFLFYSLLNFIPNDYFENIEGNIIIKLDYVNKNTLIQLHNLEFKNKYFFIQAFINKSKLNLTIYSNINYSKDLDLTKGYLDFYKLEYEFIFSSFPVFNIKFKLKLPFLTLKDNFYKLYIKDFSFLVDSIFKGDYNFYLSTSQLTFLYLYNTTKNLSIKKIDVKNLNLNLLFSTHTFDFLKVIIDGIVIKYGKNKENNINDFSLVSRFSFSNDFSNINQNKLILFLDFISFYDNFNTKWSLTNTVLCINDFDYKNNYFDIDFINKDIRFSFNIKNKEMEFIYLLNDRNYIITSSNKEINYWGIANFSMKNILNILKLFNITEKNLYFHHIKIYKNLFIDNSIYVIFKKINEKIYKDYNSYNFSIAFSDIFFNGVFSIKDFNNYKLVSNYLFNNLNVLKVLSFYYINLNNFGNIENLFKVFKYDLALSKLYGNFYFVNKNNNTVFSIFSYLFNNFYRTNFSSNFIDFYILSFLEIKNFKYSNLNFLANLFDNYFFGIVKDFKYLNLVGQIYNFKDGNFDFYLNFDIFSRKISNLVLFVNNLNLNYQANANINLYLDNLFIKFNNYFYFDELRNIFYGNLKTNLKNLKFLIDNFILSKKSLIIGNLNYFYRYQKQDIKVKLFFYKLFNDNLKMFANVNSFYNLEISNLNILLSIKQDYKNYSSKGFIYFFNELFLIKYIYSYFDLNLAFDNNKLLIKIAYIDGNFILNSLFNNKLFNFSLRIENQDNIYVSKLFVDSNLNLSINYFKLNLFTVIDIKDLNKNIGNLLKLINSNDNFAVFNRDIFNILLAYINQLWQKTYFNVDFDNNFFDILNYFEATYNLKFFKFLYLSDYDFNLIKTPDIFLVKISSRNNDFLNFKLSLSSNKIDTFLYLDYLFYKNKVVDLSLEIKDYSLLFLPNLLSINNKDILLSFNLYPYSVSLFNIYFNLFFKSSFSFFYNYIDNYNNDNYNNPLFSFTFNGALNLDNLKKINKLKINYINANINLSNFYVFNFNKFKVIDLNLNSNLELSFIDFYIDLVKLSNNDELYKILKDFIKNNTNLNLDLNCNFYFANQYTKDIENVYLSSFNKLKISLNQDKYLTNFEINIPFSLFRLIPSFDKYFNFHNESNLDKSNINSSKDWNSFLNTLFVSFNLNNSYITKSDTIQLIKKENLFKVLSLFLENLNIKLYGLYSYYSYQVDIKILLSKNYKLNLIANLFEDNQNFAYLKLNELDLININKLKINDILKNSEIHIQDFQLINKILNSKINFYLDFKNSELTINFKEFNVNFVNNNLKIDGILNILSKGDNLIIKNLPNVLFNNSIVNYNLSFSNKAINLSFYISNLKNIKVNIFDYDNGNILINGFVEFELKNNKFNINIYSKFSKGELKVIKMVDNKKNNFLYNYLNLLNIDLEANNVKNKNIIWDVNFNSNLNINLKDTKLNGILKINKGILRLNDGVYRIIQGNIKWENNLYGDMYILAQKLGTSPFDYKLTFIKGSIKDFIISNFRLYNKQKDFDFNNLNNLLNLNDLNNNLYLGLGDFMGLDVLDYSNSKVSGYIRVGKEITKNIFVFYLRKIGKSNLENLNYDYYISVDYLIKRFSKGVLLFNTSFYNNSKNNFGFIFVYGF
jgi:hypothetical protein